MAINNWENKKKTIDDVFDFNVIEKIALAILILGSLFSLLSIMKYQAIEEQKNTIFQSLFTYRQYKAYEEPTKYVKAHHDQYAIDSLEPEHAFLAIEKLNEYIKNEWFVIRGLTFSPVELWWKDKFSKLNVTMTLDWSYMKFLKTLEDFKDYKIIEKFSFRWWTVPTAEFPWGGKIDFLLSFYYKGKLSEEMLKKMEELKVVPVIAQPQPLPNNTNQTSNNPNDNNTNQPSNNPSDNIKNKIGVKLPNIKNLKKPN